MKKNANRAYPFWIIGEEVIPSKYDWEYDFYGGLALVKLNGKWGYVDKSSKEVIPCKYDDACHFNNGLAKVKLNGKWGYINKKGEEVISLKYDTISSFSDGLARIKLNEKYGYVDKKGKEVVPCKYDWSSEFCNGLFPVKLSNKYGYVDKEGKEIIPPIFNDATIVKPFIIVFLKQCGVRKCGVINFYGEFILPCQYDEINVLDKRIIAKKDNIEFIFDEIGELVEEKH